MSSLPAPVPAPHTKAGLSLFEDQYWYASGISERKAEEVLSKTGQPGAFLVRDCLLPEADYVLSVNSGSEVWHFNIEVDPTNECEFNGYLFTSLPEAITFYTENRLRSVYLVPPERPVVRDVDTPKVAGPVIKAATLATPPPPPTRSTPLQTRLIQKPQQQERREEAPSEHLYSTIPSPPTEPPLASKPPPPPPSPLIQHPQPNYPSSHTPQPPPPSNIPPPVHTSSTLPPPTSPPPPPPTHSSGSAHPPPPPPPPPPRSSQPTTSGTAWEEGTDSGLPSSGGDTSADSNSPERQNTNHFVLNTNSSQDQVTVNGTSSHSRVGTEEDDVESLYIQPTDIVDPTFPEDQIAAHMSSIGQVTGPSDICETRFDAASSFAAPEDHSSVQHTMTEKGDMYAVVDKQGVSPPGENRQPSPEQPDKIHEPSEQIKAELASKKRVELQNLPSIEQKKKQLEKQMTEEREGQGKPSRVTAPPGRVVISRVMQRLPTAPYTGQHPALLRKQEAAARERQREREEWERQEMERKAREREAREREQREREQREREAREREEEERKAREKEEKKKKRFSFIRGLSKKEKEPEMKREHDEPQEAELVTRSLPTSPEHQVPPGVAVVVPISAEQQDELQSKFANIARHKWSDPQSSSSHSLPRDTDTHKSGVLPQSQPTEEQLQKRNGCRPNTLERTVPKRPSSNPPSLPGSHHSSMERSSRSRSGSRPDTLERVLRPSSRPGSRQGTMERVSPPPPTSQPPPAPAEARSWKNGSRPSRPLVTSWSAGHVGLGGRTQMNLLEAVLGVEPALLASPPRDGPSQLPYYKPRSFTTTATFPSSSHYSPQTQPLREETVDEGHTHLLGKGMQVAGVYVGGGSRTGSRGVSPTSPQPVSPDSAPMSTKRDSKRKRSMKYK